MKVEAGCSSGCDAIKVVYESIKSCNAKIAITMGPER